MAVLAEAGFVVAVRAALPATVDAKVDLQTQRANARFKR
jgi:hypothetical protein